MARKNWKQVLDDVYKNNETFYITSHDREIAVITSINFKNTLKRESECILPPDNL